MAMAREKRPGSTDWLNRCNQRRRSESSMEIREKRACRSARLNSYAARTCAPRIRRTRWKFESYTAAFFPDDCFIVYRESQFAGIRTRNCEIFDILRSTDFHILFIKEEESAEICHEQRHLTVYKKKANIYFGTHNVSIPFISFYFV